MNYKDLQLFYAERMMELFNMNTLDSYRVRANNAFSLLEEMRDVCHSFMLDNIKNFDTVKGCGDELLDALKSGDCIIKYSDYGKDNITAELEAFLKSKGDVKNGCDVKKMMFLLDSCIEVNKEDYTAQLFEKIENFIFDEVTVYDNNSWMVALCKIEYLTKELSCQMILSGFSKSFLYLRASKLKKKAETDIDHFRNLYERQKSEIINLQKHPYTIVFKVIMSEKVEGIGDLDLFYTEISDDIIPAEIKDRYTNFFKLSPSSYLIVENAEGVDSSSALQSAKEQVANKLDAMQHGGSLLKMSLNRMALVYKRDNGFNKLYSTNFVLDGSFIPKVGRMRDASSKFNVVLNSTFVDDDTKERLRSALRHLRIANEDSEIEQQFINYWLALEFMFSSPLSSESTFARIKTNLVNMLLSCYLKRNMTYVNKELIRCGRIANGDVFWNKTDEGLKNIIDAITSPLLSLRLTKMKSRKYGEAARDKREKYLKNNEKNLVRHLIRMYRLRNELVHEAAIKQDIQNVTSNLRYYLVFTINQLVEWLLDADRNQRKTGLEEMFYHYEMLRKKIFRDFNFDDMMAVKLSDGYIR